MPNISGRSFFDKRFILICDCLNHAVICNYYTDSFVEELFFIFYKSGDQMSILDKAAKTRQIFFSNDPIDYLIVGAEEADLFADFLASTKFNLTKDCKVQDQLLEIDGKDGGMLSVEFDEEIRSFNFSIQHKGKWKKLSKLWLKGDEFKYDFTIDDERDAQDLYSFLKMW